MTPPAFNTNTLLKFLWPSKLRSQLILGIALVHLVLMSVFVYDLIGRQRAFLREQNLEHVKVFARTLATNSKALIQSGNIAGLAELLGKERHYHIVRGIMVLDAEGQVLAHTDQSLHGKYLRDDLTSTLLRSAPAVQVLSADARDLDIAAPILNASGKCLGWARIIHDREYVEESLDRISLDGALYTLLAILTGTLFAIFIGNRLTKELGRLLAFTASIKAGRHDLRLSTPPSGYELSQLSEGFNRMLDAMAIRSRDNAELRHILDNLSEGCMIIGHDWRYTYVNAAAAAQRATSQDTLLGSSAIEPSPNTENRTVTGAYRRCMEKRVRMHFETKLPFGAEQLHCYSLNIEPVPAGIFVLSVDITELKLAARNLAESEAKFRRLIEALSEGIWMIDKDANTTYANPSMAEMLGYTAEEMQGKNLSQFIDDKTGPMAEFHLERRKRGIKEQHDFEFIKKDGTRIYTIVETTPLLDTNGNYDGALAAVTDITDRKRMQKDLAVAHTLNIRTEELKQANLRLLERDQLKSIFIASMSHELRTPLNSIIGFSSTLLKEWYGPVNDEQKENLATILSAGNHLHKLINEIIDVSKIEAGKMESELEEFDLRDLVDEALATIASQHSGKGLNFSAARLSLPMRTDRRRLLQCLINLLGNAAKFTPAGSVAVGIKEIRTAAGAGVDITVTDTGIGIKMEDVPRLFSPFLRLPGPTTDKIPGTGLGLHLVKKITTEILKGEVYVNSVYGQGSSFVLRIPVRLE